MVLQDRTKTATRRLVLIYVALPLAYVIAGRLGLMLAVSPGYATAVFLPAGIAVAAAFMMGASSLPGVLLGSFVLNIWIGYSLGHEVDAINLATAAMIAAASALQAGIGGVALRRAIGYPAPLDNPRDLLLFLLLAPLFCLTSATVSTGGMWALGVLPRGEIEINWLTWWVGDTLGVLVALPLMLVLGGEPRRLWQLRVWFVAVPMILCFALFVAVFIRVRDWERMESLTDFHARSQQLADSLKADLDEQALFLKQLSSAFVNRHAAIDRDDFHGLVQVLLQHFPAIQAVEWAPRIAASERLTFEAAQRQSIPGFAIRERIPSGEMRPAADRPAFYPVTYIEPFAGNEAVAGFDLASDNSRRVAIDTATDTGTITATAPIRLVQELGRQAGVLMISAVPDGATGSGVLLVALRMGSFAQAALAPFQSILGLRLTDGDAGETLFDSLAAIEPAYQTVLDFGTRRYLVHTAPSAAYLAGHHGWQSWLVLAGGVLSTGLLGGLFMLGTGYTYRVRVKEEELETVLDQTPFMLARCGRDLRYRFISESYAEMLGRHAEDVVGKPIAEIVGDEAFKRMLPYIEQVLKGNRVEYENEISFRGAAVRAVYTVYTPDRNERDEVVGWIASVRDITEQKQAQVRERTLLLEIQHRSNNLLAIVQTIAHRSLAGGQTTDEAKKVFESRLQALARANRQLTQSNWRGVALREIVRLEMEPFGGRTTMDGVDVILDPKQAQNFSLALHELATNAGKYGALSNGGGNVGISWTITANGETNILKFCWQERGGPTVSEPVQFGFGTALLKATFPGINLRYAPAGLICEMELSLYDGPSDELARSGAA
jgi:PAS domain S-box-containing protein